MESTQIEAVVSSSCAKCGNPSTKKYCEKCVSERFGVIVDREVETDWLGPGWKTLSDGCFRRINRIGDAY